MNTQTNYHPSVVITYMILIGLIIVVGLSKRITKPRDTEPQTLTPERHEPQLHVTVNPDLYQLKRTG